MGRPALVDWRLSSWIVRFAAECQNNMCSDSWDICRSVSSGNESCKCVRLQMSVLMDLNYPRRNRVREQRIKSFAINLLLPHRAIESVDQFAAQLIVMLCNPHLWLSFISASSRYWVTLHNFFHEINLVEQSVTTLAGIKMYSEKMKIDKRRKKRHQYWFNSLSAFCEMLHGYVCSVWITWRRPIMDYRACDLVFSRLINDAASLSTPATRYGMQIVERLCLSIKPSACYHPVHCRLQLITQ